MSDKSGTPQTNREPMSNGTTRLIGLLVFLAGVAMIALVFIWAYGLFSSAGQEFSKVTVTQTTPVPSPATAGGEVTETTTEAVTVATPSSGISLTEVGATFAVKLAFLVLMAWVGTLVASKGAQMAKQSRPAA